MSQNEYSLTGSIPVYKFVQLHANIPTSVWFQRWSNFLAIFLVDARTANMRETLLESGIDSKITSVLMRYGIVVPCIVL